MTISVIILVFNEADVIRSTIQKLLQQHLTNRIIEIIVVDGGCTDDTAAKAQQAGAIVIQSTKGRAFQMNEGANIAKGEIHYSFKCFEGHLNGKEKVGLCPVNFNHLQINFSLVYLPKFQVVFSVPVADLLFIQYLTPLRKT